MSLTSLIDRLESLTVRVASPGGNLVGEADSERQVRLWFREPGLFHDYRPEGLAREVGALLSGLEVGRRRARRHAYDREGFDSEALDEPSWDAQRRRYLEALANVESHGTSHKGSVRLRTTGRMDVFEARIHPQALERLNADGFLMELRSAYYNLRTDHNQRRYAVKREHLDI